MTVNKQTIRSDLKNLESSDNKIANILEKYIEIYKSDNKMSEIKKDVQEVQFEMILTEPNYKSKMGIYTLDKNGKITKRSSQNTKNEISKSAINFSKEFIINGSMKKTRNQIDEKLYDFIKDLKREFTDAKSNRWSTFVGRVKRAHVEAQKTLENEGKEVQKKDRNIELSIVESLFSSLFGRDILNVNKPINKNAFLVRMLKSDEGFSSTKFVEIFYPAFIQYLEKQDLKTEHFTLDTIKNVISEVQKS
jgi:hypothetical protein|tara:strand:- start:8 stop:754 length:747 start_codon:yes stop_codon:yes gene_type:complete